MKVRLENMINDMALCQCMLETFSNKSKTDLQEEQKFFFQGKMKFMKRISKC